MIEHHADFAVSISQRLWLDTLVPRRNGTGLIAGWAIALGWWVDPGAEQRGESVGTLYLVVDPHDDGPPAWVREGNVRRAGLRYDAAPEPGGPDLPASTT